MLMLMKINCGSRMNCLSRCADWERAVGAVVAVATPTYYPLSQRGGDPFHHRSFFCFCAYLFGLCE